MELDKFLASLRTRMPEAPITGALVMLNIAVFAGLAIAAGDPISIPADVLARWGGNEGGLTLAGQPWRLLSSVFLHGGLLHVALNMLALYQAGQLVERMFGSARYLVAYLGAGVLASLASVWWQQDVVSIGASGAIFGVFGALLAFLVAHRHRLPSGVYGTMRKMTLSFVGYSLLLGLLIPGVDNAAHLGGLTAGLAFGWILATLSSPGRAAAALCVPAALAVAFWSTVDAPPARGVVARFAADQPLLAAREGEVLEQLAKGDLPARDALQVIDRELKPNWDRLIAELEAGVAAGEPAAGALLEYARLERSALDALALGLSTGHPAWMATAADLRAEANRSLAGLARRHAPAGAGEAAPRPNRGEDPKAGREMR